MIDSLTCNLQPLYKGQLQRLLLNLCTHHETRTSLVKILMDMLMLDLRGSINNSVDSAESPFRLYGCQSHVAYSRPQFNGGIVLASAVHLIDCNNLYMFL